MSEARDKVVFDCMVFAQALISPRGPAGACLELARARKLQLIISAYVLQEIRELPGKINPKLLVTAERIEALVEQVVACADYFDSIPEVYLNPFDKDDSHYINLAVASDAKVITSRDGDLLNLMDQLRPEGRDFSARFKDIEILPPEVLLQRIRAKL
jgi:putative PIN family toxin of toxin-antitoxin system